MLFAVSPPPPRPPPPPPHTHTHRAPLLPQVSSLAAVPTSPTFNGALNGAVVDSFTADAEQRSMPVTFDTGRSSYYIVAAR